MTRGVKTHQWLYSNTSEVWFCERCHRWDRTGKEVDDTDPCPMASRDLAVAACTSGPDCCVQGHEMTPVRGMGPAS